MKLKPFGHGGNHGTIDLGYIIGYLESLINAEEERGDISAGNRTRRERRLNLAHDALMKLNQMHEMGNESR